MAKNKLKNKLKDTSEDTILDENPENTKTEECIFEEPVQSEVDSLKDQLLRQAAEYDNYRKRTAKERLDLVPEITAGNITELLPVIDNIERAIEAKCTDENYKKGIEMIYQSFCEALKNLGVEEIKEEMFDPSLHQAVQQIEHETLESGTVFEVFQKGYKIGDRIIRFAMVSIVK